MPKRQREPEPDIAWVEAYLDEMHEERCMWIPVDVKKKMHHALMTHPNPPHSAMKKFTWFITSPLNYADGMWDSF